jgi:hypothetical protein
MNVVVVGSREWSGEQATNQVNELLAMLKQKYSGLVVVTSSTDKGVGRIVRDRCLKDKTSFQFVDIHVRVFAQLPRTKLAQVFFARNAALDEIGEEFHVFVDTSRKGAFEDLIEKVKSTDDRLGQRRPLFEYLPQAQVKES